MDCPTAGGDDWPGRTQSPRSDGPWNREDEEEVLKWELCSSLLAFSSLGATQSEREVVSACRGALQVEEGLVGWSQASSMAWT